jgi:hypothetical protein
MKAAVTFLVAPWTVLFNGAVLVMLWRWFITPFGAPPLGLAHAIGIAMTVHYLTRTTDLAEIEEEHRWWARPASSVLAGLIALGIGWLASRFM